VEVVWTVGVDVLVSVLFVPHDARKSVINEIARREVN